MDEFVDQLLTEERVCDLILPRITKRDVLEDLGEIGPRKSRLLDAMEGRSDHERSRSRSRSRSGDSGAKCSSRVAFAKAAILTRIALDARFPNKSESASGIEADSESSSESLRIAYCDRP